MKDFAKYSDVQKNEIFKVYGGIDEAGKGPVIGPMAIGIVVADEDIMKSIGAKDSKKLSQASRIRIGEIIRREAEYWDVNLIDSSYINERMNEMTINRMEEIEVSRIIEKSGYSHFIVDSFDVNEKRLSSVLSTMTGRSVVCRHKADQLYANVSAASILAKLSREEAMDRIRKDYGDTGSGYPSDPRTIDFLKRSIMEGVDISGIVRTHWKTYTSLLNEINQKRIF
ncbi:ribonuclease HII [Cuniculiplasma sp. SKW4]|uniref:ribonuclease HII n=1 Tax=Cuniculiplasma sp. SKW4 TaxID=3400171 RepID=UPI003FD64206